MSLLHNSVRCFVANVYMSQSTLMNVTRWNFYQWQYCSSLYEKATRVYE